MQNFGIMSGIGAAILVAAIAFILWRGRRQGGHVVPTAADIHVPPPPFAAYGH